MKGLYSNLSLHFKIMLTVILLTMTVSGLAIAIFIYNDMAQYQKLTSIFNNIITQSSSISAAVIDNNQTATIEQLQNLKLDPDIESADLFFYKGKTIKKYSLKDIPTKKNDVFNNLNHQTLSFLDKKLELLYPIIKQGHAVGAIYIQSKNNNNYIYSLIEIIILITVIAIILAMYLGEHITQPLSSFIDVMKTVAKNDYSIRIKKTTNDEVGILIENFNSMLEHIQKNNKALIKTSRLAGMTEVSASILHNVGNVLNSVNVTNKVIHEKVEKLKVAELSSLVVLLNENKEKLGSFFFQDEKGKRVIGYLTKTADYLIKEKNELIQELNSLDKNIGHIKSVIATQQSMSKVRGVMEQVILSDVMQDVIDIHKTSLVSHLIQFEYSNSINKTFQLFIDRANVEQIIINLIRNAIDSVILASKTNKIVSLNTRLDPDSNMVIIEVTDNGEGISPENLNTIFNFGFTTKKEGHGFGLHASVLAAKEMGGDLLVKSDGINCGATFTLTFPLSLKSQISRSELNEART